MGGGSREKDEELSAVGVGQWRDGREMAAMDVVQWAVARWQGFSGSGVRRS